MTSPPAVILIRDIEQLSEFQAVEELQKEIWGVEDREVLPALAMIPLKEVGGVLLGAFDGNQLVGFAFAFPGFEQARCILHSDMLAVKPEYRSQGVGLQLKLAQRTRALEKGIDTITWTFDPLQALNANLNFGKLGVIAERYLPDFYGQTTSFLHSTGTDRLWVTWQLNSRRVTDRIERDMRNDRLANEDVLNLVEVGDRLEPIRSVYTPCRKLFIDIPADINKLVKENPTLAWSWRLATREAFTTTLAEGFFVEDFYLIKDSDRSFGRYLLSRKTEPSV